VDSKATSDDFIEQLNKLVKLHADGILTDEDFKALKAKLLFQMDSRKNGGGSIEAPKNQQGGGTHSDASNNFSSETDKVHHADVS
jgi:hypothetical protein